MGKKEDTGKSYYGMPKGTSRAKVTVVLAVVELHLTGSISQSVNQTVMTKFFLNSTAL